MSQSITSRDIEPLIDQVYALATEMDGFTAVAQHVARLSRSRSCCFMLQDAKTFHLESGWFWGMDMEWAVVYRDKYFQHDPTVIEHFKIPDGQAYASAYHCENAEFCESIFFREWCEPQQLGYFAGAYTMLDNRLALRVTLQGDMSRGQYEPDTLHAIQALLPHLLRACRINQRFIEIESSAQALSDSLENGRLALILLDRNSEVLHCNAEAKSLMRGVISVRDKQLRTHASASQKLLDGTIRASLAMLEMSSGETLLGGFHVPIPRTGKSALSAYVTPIRTVGIPETGPWQGDYIRIQLIDPDARLDLDAGQIEQVMGLSTAEARVAALLCRGLGTAQISEQLNLSQFTVRDHIKSIYRRTDVNRQSEFVAKAVYALRPALGAAPRLD